MKADGERRPFPWKLVRRLVLLAIVLALVGIVVDARLIEPRWLATPVYTVGDYPQVKIVQLSDLHYQGDRAYLERVVAKVNAIHPDFVCFTGDLVEEDRYLDEACEILRGLKVPLYAVPGNHDYWGGDRRELCRETCAATGGKWLEDECVYVLDGKVLIAGLSGRQLQLTPPPPPDGTPPLRRLLLVHFPKSADDTLMGRFDLVLAGHTHGGQVMIPFAGPIILPQQSSTYAAGWYETRSGPLYVSRGIGTFMFKIRFNCRPELPTFIF